MTCLTGFFFFINYSSLSLLHSCLLFASWWWNKEDLLCHYMDGQMIESYEGRASLSLQDLHNENVSLTLEMSGD